MLRLALLSARGRLSTFIGAFVALAASATLVVAGGMPFEAALRSHPPVERYAAAAAVVTGQQTVGADHDVPLGERARVDAALAGRLAAVPGVRAAIGDVSTPARLGDHTTAAHGWSSAPLTPYVLTRGRAPAGANEVVTGYGAKLGARLRLSSTEGPKTVTVVGVARPRHAVEHGTSIFLTDTEATRLAGHPGRVDAIGVLAGSGFDAARLKAVSGGATVFTGNDRGKAESPDRQEARTTLIAATASFGGLALFIAIFVVASTMGLSIQQREREIALLRAVAGSPGQIRRMISWEAVIVGLAGSAAGIWPGIVMGRALADGLVRHGIAPADLTVSAGLLPIAAAVGGGGVAHPRAGPGRGRAAAARPRPHHRRARGARRRRAAVRRRGDHRLAADGRRDLGDDRTVPRGRRGLSRADRGAHRRRDPRAAARADFARRRLPGLVEPEDRHAALLVRQHAADADRRHELHAAVQLDHDGPRRHQAAQGGPVGRAGDHDRRSRHAGRDAGRRARHPRRALGRRADADDARPQPGGRRRRHPRRGSQRRAGRRPRRRRDRRVAQR